MSEQSDRVSVGSPLSDVKTLPSIGLSLPLVQPPTRVSPDVLVSDWLASESGWLRSNLKLLGQDSEAIHSDALAHQLETRTLEAERQPVEDLLTFVSDSGFSWPAVARLLGVSVSDTRKWRQGEPVTNSNLKKLAQLVAFCEIMSEAHLVSHVASWMESEIVVRSGDSYYTALDVYETGHISELVQYAAEHLSADDLLQHARLTFDEPEQFEIFRASDGEYAIRLRQS